MAEYDLPAMINKAIETTGEPKVFYIGHSMGTTTLMAMSDIHPEMKEKIILASLLAPVGFVEHMKSPIALMAPFANIMDVIDYTLLYHQHIFEPFHKHPNFQDLLQNIKTVSVH